MKNLFIVSHLGQLKQVDSLIKIEGLKNNSLVILYTNRNKVMPEIIKSQACKDIFNSIQLFRIPNSPNKFTFKKSHWFVNNYSTLIKKESPSTCFVLSFENHYSILISILNKKNIKVNLVDEGTGTYKKIKKTLIQKAPRSGITYIDAIIDFHRPAIKFNELFVSFPSLIDKAFRYKKINQFFLHSGGVTINNRISNLVKKYNITQNDIIYVNQRYNFDISFFCSFIIETLRKISTSTDSRIFLKLHPKDTSDVMRIMNDHIENDHLSDKLIMISESDFLIEPTISIVKPKAIIGLTSTSLIYSTLVHNSIKPISIAPMLINSGSQYQDGCKVIKEHLNILSHFNIATICSTIDCVITAITDLSKKNKKTKKSINIELIKNATASGHHLKSICLIEESWSGVESLDNKLFSIYINNLFETNRHEQVIFYCEKRINSLQECDHHIYIKSCLHESLLNKISAIKKEIISQESGLLVEYLIKSSMHSINVDFIEYINLAKLNDEQLLSLAKYYPVHLNIQSTHHPLILLSETIKHYHNKNYDFVINTLPSILNDLSQKEIKEIKPEILLSNSYMKKNEYTNAKNTLISAEKHSKHSIEIEASIINLSFMQENWKHCESKILSLFTELNIPPKILFMYLLSLINQGKITQARKTQQQNHTSFSNISAINRHIIEAKLLYAEENNNNFIEIVKTNNLLKNKLISNELFYFHYSESNYSEVVTTFELLNKFKIKKDVVATLLISCLLSANYEKYYLYENELQHLIDNNVRERINSLAIVVAAENSMKKLSVNYI